MIFLLGAACAKNLPPEDVALLSVFYAGMSVRERAKHFPDGKPEGVLSLEEAISVLNRDTNKNASERRRLALATSADWQRPLGGEAIQGLLDGTPEAALLSRALEKWGGPPRDGSALDLEGSRVGDLDLIDVDVTDRTIRIRWNTPHPSSVQHLSTIVDPENWDRCAKGLVFQVTDLVKANANGDFEFCGPRDPRPRGSAYTNKTLEEHTNIAGGWFSTKLFLKVSTDWTNDIYSVDYALQPDSPMEFRFFWRENSAKIVKDYGHLRLSRSIFEESCKSTTGTCLVATKNLEFSDHPFNQAWARKLAALMVGGLLKMFGPEGLNCDSTSPESHECSPG